MAIFLSAVETGQVIDWSFSSSLLPATLLLAGRPTYFVFLAYSDVAPNFEFTIDVQVQC